VLRFWLLTDCSFSLLFCSEMILWCCRTCLITI
jgi:hypothetical protein